MPFPYSIPHQPKQRRLRDTANAVAPRGRAGTDLHMSDDDLLDREQGLSSVREEPMT